jgi:hypothetical protein
MAAAKRGRMIRTGNTEHMTVDEARSALALAAAGTTIAYARGDLATDCTGAGDGVLALQELRGLMWNAYEGGHVRLFQRRIENGQFEYQARKRNPC